MEPTNETNAIIFDTETAREKFEQARLSRRAALRKMGLTTGMALFGMFAVDDLARVAIKRMEQHKETRQVAETVAREFRTSGIAFADSSNPSDPPPCYPTGSLGGDNIGTDCAKNPTVFCDGNGSFDSCVRDACAHYSPGETWSPGITDDCVTNAYKHKP